MNMTELFEQEMLTSELSYPKINDEQPKLNLKAAATAICTAVLAVVISRSTSDTHSSLK